jgi:hypothetical protein
MTKPEAEVKKRVRDIFDMRVIRQMSKRTGYPEQTLSNWKRNPLLIKAVDLIRLEQLMGIDYRPEERTRR